MMQKFKKTQLKPYFAKTPGVYFTITSRRAIHIRSFVLLYFSLHAFHYRSFIELSVSLCHRSAHDHLSFCLRSRWLRTPRTAPRHKSIIMAGHLCVRCR